MLDRLKEGDKAIENNRNVGWRWVTIKRVLKTQIETDGGTKYWIGNGYEVSSSSSYFRNHLYHPEERPSYGGKTALQIYEDRLTEKEENKKVAELEQIIKPMMRYANSVQLAKIAEILRRHSTLTMLTEEQRQWMRDFEEQTNYEVVGAQQIIDGTMEFNQLARHNINMYLDVWCKSGLLPNPRTDHVSLHVVPWDKKPEIV